MPLTIDFIAPHSLAEKMGLKPADKILRINGNPIHDFLDLQFHGADPFLKIEWLRKEKLFAKTVQQNYEQPLGIEGNEHNCRTCINNCIFCFIDQMHPNLRTPLYVKDDDVPFSFVFGNFITLTNLTERDYERIFRQKLSPLYISVHTTNHPLHKEMLRHPLQQFSILQKLQELAENDIEYHTQIVLVPGYNDGGELKKTLQDLTNPILNTLSLGIVPVGLTNFRKNLTPIFPVDKKIAQEVIALSKNFAKTYLADEFFLLADVPIPEEDYYDDFPQLENGIGMLRLLKENWQDRKYDFVDELQVIEKSPVFVTGMLAAPYLRQITDEISKESTFSGRVQAVKNHFLGETVTVAGLLSGQDIIAQTAIKDDEIVCLSSNLFNSDMLTLDNVSLETLKQHFKNRLILIDEEFADWEVLV